VFSPAQAVSLILSDVVGDRLDTIASGPTVPDPTRFQDAKQVLIKYGLWDRVPASIAAHLQKGVAGELEETPKPDHKTFKNVNNVLVGTNLDCLQACAQEAQKQGFQPLLLSSRIRGEAKEVAKVLAAIGLEIRASAHPLKPPACVISGGEPTVTLQGKGLGGRNQELALAASLEIVGQESLAIFSAGTDGTDGPTDAAGAMAFGDTRSRGQEKGLEATTFLARNDSYHFFDAIGDLIQTGPTNTNVMDVHLVLVDL